MGPTNRLMEEHRVIERAITALNRASDQLALGKEVDLALFADAVDFIRNFADRCHHAKEEGLLFKRLTQRGLPAEGGPVGVMLAEHEEGREYVRGLAAALERYQQHDTSAVGDIVRNARSYGDLLMQHIQKEDGILYPMADRVFSAADQDELARKFDQVDQEIAGPVGGPQHYLDLVRSMESALNNAA